MPERAQSRAAVPFSILSSLCPLKHFQKEQAGQRERDLFRSRLQV